LNAGFVNVGPGYLAMMGIAVRSGRDITADDVSSTAPVAVISETLAKRLWPDGSALGRQVRQIQVTARGPEPPGPWQTVVGVAADVRQTYGDANTSDIYSPWIPDGRFGSFYTRSPTSSRTLRDVAAEIDSHAVMNPLRPVEEENRELAGTMFLTTMLAGFAGMAALVAMLGIYGVTAYAVQQREREVAIRMALGAGRSAVVQLFLRENALVVSAGVMLGIAGGLAVGRVLEHRMFGVEPFDLPVLAATATLMAAASMAAAWAPARRASRKDPAVALKEV
jgi:putative ABC transport system permease protein